MKWGESYYNLTMPPITDPEEAVSETTSPAGNSRLKGVTFFILAGGFGLRARPLSLIKAKPAFPLHGRPLVNILLDQLAKKGFGEGFLNLHHKPETLRQCIEAPEGLTIKYLYEKELSGSGILSAAAEEMAEFLLVMNGDVFMDFSTLPIARMRQELVETGADGMLLLRENNNGVYSSILTDNNGRFMGIAPQAGAGGAAGVGKGGAEKKDAGMYTGVALFRRKVIRCIRDKSFFSTLARHSFHIGTTLYKGRWWDLGNPGLYFSANFLYKNEVQKDPASNSLSPGVSIGADAWVQHTIAWENTQIKGRSTISDCIVTGNLTLENVNYKGKIIYGTEGVPGYCVTDL